MIAKQQPVKVAVDAMGGDYAPYEVIAGAIEAARKSNVHIALVGDTNKIGLELSKYDVSDLSIKIVQSTNLKRNSLSTQNFARTFVNFMSGVQFYLSPPKFYEIASLRNNFKDLYCIRNFLAPRSDIGWPSYSQRFMRKFRGTDLQCQNRNVYVWRIL